MVAHLFTHMELYNLNFLMTSSLRNVAFHEANNISLTIKNYCYQIVIYQLLLMD
uniref:Uncharacterized protein n=1 Tax=Manihot esculenta TaxID=3983 RepID=A0A2C9W3N7_MANES